MTAKQALAQLDQYNFYQHIMEESGLTVVCFTSPHCSSCHAVRHALAELQQLDDTITVYEIDAVMNPALNNAFGFFHLPTLYLYIDGHFHAEIHAQPSARSLQEAIGRLSEQPAQEEP